jgi:plasmid maintenance system antidote protein VapI
MVRRGSEEAMRLPTHRAPTTPVEILLEEWLKPMKLTQLALAKNQRALAAD